ncbi:hypothetical protein GIB67_037177, partial [Kingdonia uniflora]
MQTLLQRFFSATKCIVVFFAKLNQTHASILKAPHCNCKSNQTHGNGYKYKLPAFAS